MLQGYGGLFRGLIENIFDYFQKVTHLSTKSLGSDPDQPKGGAIRTGTKTAANVIPAPGSRTDLARICQYEDLPIHSLPHLSSRDCMPP
ncbi:hypothetical protein D3C80_1098020 [compost metagenome]